MREGSWCIRRHCIEHESTEVGMDWSGLASLEENPRALGFKNLLFIQW